MFNLSNYKPVRPMKYPYTFSAKLVQFPWVFYIKKNWIWQYYFLAVGVCVPIFNFCENLSKTPGNRAKWAAIKLKEAQEELHH